MKYAAMPTIPVTELRTKQPEIFNSLKDAPLMLTRQGYGAGVLVHPDTWNELLAELERSKRQRRERLNQASARIDAGEFITLDQAKAELRERGLLP